MSVADTFLATAFIGAAIVIPVIVYMAMKLLDARKRTTEALGALDDFTANKTVFSENTCAGIAIDEGRQKLALMKKEPGVIKVITYKDLVSAEIFEDGNSVTRTSRAGQFGGAVVGGLVLGGVGAIIGGLSGKKVTESKCNRIELRLVINDTSEPTHDVVFLDQETERNFVYKNAMDAARSWHAMCSVFIKRADEAQEKVKVKKKDGPVLATEELAKLVDLKNSGVLNDEEFAKLKARLIASIDKE
ncbi:SHOCT domain-containing protein [Pseudomonas nitroreducens]|uniref:SHOCT domain-containing protein n=1 Tax=Rhizophagus irregularis (strain DAOM 181602 / DAOM 197198 / MUCL 43194) TaxID=747089 RepID=U9T9F3_RHIID|nr:SHOCT domain-containing protein [Pseudomonas nitroreducens]MDG9852887.1 SHOCT domain-containing protein [Pseudomonas nitroreducens]MDH1077186.1 SHOCT domain-containing protein [Pseudomonas nitroreducens]NMZ76711.1 SHOCT domain-containing protein [Pseudomonas nitroreducens]HCL3146628.1 hypothetical protein [Pseudomonas aeruginosa]